MYECISKRSGVLHARLLVEMMLSVCACHKIGSFVSQLVPVTSLFLETGNSRGHQVRSSVCFQSYQVLEFIDKSDFETKDRVMAKLHFRYGVMGSSKTAEALMLAYNFRERGRLPLLAKPACDTRTEKIWSRIGIEADCISLEEVCAMPFQDLGKYDCIIVDEVQFSTAEQIDQLASITDIMDISVFTFGLRTDYTGHLFEGSRRLFEIADEIEEIRTSCWCGKAAKMNALIAEDGHIIKEQATESQLHIGGNYLSLCRKHYNEERFKS